MNQDLFNRTVALYEKSLEHPWEREGAHQLRRELTMNTIVAPHQSLFDGQQVEISILPGWVSIVADLCQRLIALTQTDPHLKVQIFEVKEKHGHLCVRARYTWTGDNGIILLEHQESMKKVDELIIAAENQAAVTCEVCGEPGELIFSGWQKVYCKKHAKEEV
jgi:hypothetical protein